MDSAECCPLQEAWRSHRHLVLGGSRGMGKGDFRITAGKAGPEGPSEVTSGNLACSFYRWENRDAIGKGLAQGHMGGPSLVAWLQ